MNEKQVKNNKLVWKYFFQQKIIEIASILLILSSIIFAPYYVGKLTATSINSFFIKHLDTFAFPENPVGLDYWVCGATSIMLSFIVIFVLYMWVNANWEKAKDRAGVGDSE